AATTVASSHSSTASTNCFVWSARWRKGPSRRTGRSELTRPELTSSSLSPIKGREQGQTVPKQCLFFGQSGCFSGQFGSKQTLGGSPESRWLGLHNERQAPCYRTDGRLSWSGITFSGSIRPRYRMTHRRTSFSVSWQRLSGS